MTVFHNMAFSLDLQGVSKAEIRQRVEAAAQILQMEHLLDRRPAALSGGQRQRVAIGRAIVRNPDGFLFDEPLSNLDAALRHDTRVEIKKLHDQLGATTIYVTHDQVEAMTLADKIVVLKDGKVMQFEGEGFAAGNVKLVSTDKGAGEEVRLGIRPQHMTIDPSGPIKGTVTLVERLGTETVVELISDQKKPFRFASPESLDMATGGEVSFSFSSDKAHLF